MKRVRTVTAMLSIVGSFSPWAFAQHADFVLFGDPNSRAAEVPAEHDFVHRVTAPYFNEDSFVTTDIRAVYVYHNFPSQIALGGGDAWVAAVQARVALTEQLQLVAYKDGWLDIDTPAVDESGWNDIAAGLKWNFLQDWDNQFHMAVGAGYEFRTGNGKVLQNDSEFRLWTSLDKGFNKLHLGGTFNVFFGEDSNSGLGNSDWLLCNFHADYWICKWFSPLVELNWYHTFNEGFAPLPFSVVDVANLGGGKGEDVIALGVGVELRPWERISMRAAYETPLNNIDEQLFGYRWTFSMIFEF